MTNEYEIGKDLQKHTQEIANINANIQILVEEIEAVKEKLKILNEAE